MFHVEPMAGFTGGAEGGAVWVAGTEVGGRLIHVKQRE